MTINRQGDSERHSRRVALFATPGAAVIKVGALWWLVFNAVAFCVAVLMKLAGPSHPLIIAAGTGLAAGSMLVGLPAYAVSNRRAAMVWLVIYTLAMFMLAWWFGVRPHDSDPLIAVVGLLTFACGAAMAWWWHGANVRPGTGSPVQ
jgi:hypothetical protein